MKRLLIVAALTWGNVAAANASDWWFVGYAGNKPHRVVNFLDTASILKPAPNVVRGWATTYYETIEVNSPKVRLKKTLVEYDCDKRTSSLISIATYDTNENILDSTNIDNIDRVSIVPDSVGEYKYNFFCLQNREGAMKLPDEASPQDWSKSVLEVLDQTKAQ